jgi:hypothetical protein
MNIKSSITESTPNPNHHPHHHWFHYLDRDQRTRDRRKARHHWFGVWLMITLFYLGLGAIYFVCLLVP